MLGDGSDRPPQLTDDPAPSSPSATSAAPTERTESWRDLQVTVPASWGHGTLAEWCSNGTTEPGEPVVERAGGMRDMTLCTEPANGYGVMFFDGSAADLAYRAGHIWSTTPASTPAIHRARGWAMNAVATLATSS
jgi:hypothetical protein